MLKRGEIKAIIEVIIIIGLFLFASYLIQDNIDYLKGIIGVGLPSMLFYVSLTIIAVVIAPISATPLLPLASNLWGWFFAGVLSIIGWTIGAMIAFIVARKYGVFIIKKFIPLNKISKIEKRIPKKHVFWSIVLLRLVLPVDILSYALGLFSKIRLRLYFSATIVGLAPFAFVLAYLGVIRFEYQVLAFLAALIILLLGYGVKERIKKKRKNNILGKLVSPK